ncbi:MAG: hypothetical protein QM725_14580 [Lacibacter sp.]
MDFQTAITALLIILVVVLPFYYHHIKHSRKEKKLFQILKEAAEKKGCKITRKQVFFQSAIGLDEKQQKLLFVHINNGLTDFSFVSLDGLKHSTVQIQTAKQNGSDMPDKVELLLRFNNTAAKDEILVFFDRNSGTGSLSDEVLGARKWADYLSLSYINSK